ncbi:hypothetical protein SAMN05216565_103289 [Litchfieldia salsa]|uniref:Uncharacterized protein n=1 Tax=Litchfieldia salsa TaxID=930152 RepID=A0A1H0T550_9BACI|nr:hypothetical protein SAMN05216565_103289 [Litchfieldia salsa]
MKQLVSAIKIGFLATLAMEVFLRVNGGIFNHNVNFA